MVREDGRVLPKKAALVASGSRAHDPPEIPGIQVGDWQSLCQPGRFLQMTQSPGPEKGSSG